MYHVTLVHGAFRSVPLVYTIYPSVLADLRVSRIPCSPGKFMEMVFPIFGILVRLERIESYQVLAICIKRDVKF